MGVPGTCLPGKFCGNLGLQKCDFQRFGQAASIDEDNEAPF